MGKRQLDTYNPLPMSIPTSTGMTHSDHTMQIPSTPSSTEYTWPGGATDRWVCGFSVKQHRWWCTPPADPHSYIHQIPHYPITERPTQPHTLVAVGLATHLYVHTVCVQGHCLAPPTAASRGGVYSCRDRHLMTSSSSKACSIARSYCTRSPAEGKEGGRR